MFKKKLMFKIEDAEVIEFCRLLGKYGLRFEIGKLRSVARDDDGGRKLYYRVFAVYATKRQTYTLYEELNMNRDSAV